MEEDAARAELKKKARKSKEPESADVGDIQGIVEVGKFDFLGSALSAVLHSSDASVPLVLEKPSKGAKRSAGTSNTPGSASGETPRKSRRGSLSSMSPVPSASPSPPPGSKGKGKKGAETGLRPSEIRAKRVREEQKLSTAVQKCQHILENVTENTTSLEKMNTKSMAADLKKLREALTSGYLDLCKDEGGEQLHLGLDKHSQAPHVSVTFHYT